MPGVVGLVTRMPRQHAELELQRMLGAIHHESFYSARTWIDEELGVYLGCTAREGSFSDTGHVQNETRDIVLASRKNIAAAGQQLVDMFDQHEDENSLL